MPASSRSDGGRLGVAGITSREPSDIALQGPPEARGWSQMARARRGSRATWTRVWPARAVAGSGLPLLPIGDARPSDVRADGPVAAPAFGHNLRTFLRQSPGLLLQGQPRAAV